MDTSEAYIKMCDCKEIQKDKKFDSYWDDESIPDLFYIEAEIREKHGIGSRPPKLEEYKGMATNGADYLRSVDQGGGEGVHG